MTGADRIDSIDLSLAFLPLATPVSDAKGLTGRQQPLTRVAFLFARVRTADGAAGLGFSYAKRAGGPGLYAHAREIAPELIGEDPSDIGRLWEKLAWAGASVGRGGLAVQAIAALDVALWDLKARRAGLPLAKLLVSYRDRVPCYNTSGGFLSSSLAEVLDNARTSLALGIGGIKIKVGHPDSSVDIGRVQAVREAIGPAVPLMVDANQQWTRATALRVGRPRRARGPGDRRARRRPVGPQGAPCWAAAGQAARRLPRRRSLLQHLGRVPVLLPGGGAR